MSEETVTMPKAEMDMLLAQVKLLTKSVQDLQNNKGDVDEHNGRPRIKQVKERTVTVLFIDGKPIVGLKNIGTEETPLRVYEVIDPRNPKNTILEATILLKDLKTNTIEQARVNWIECVQNATKRNLRVVNVIDGEWYYEDGVTSKKEVVDWTTNELDIEIPLSVEGNVRTFNVDVDGVALQIHEDYVNIAK